MRLLLTLGLFTLALNATATDNLKDPTNGKWVIESVTRDGKAEDGLKGASRVHDSGKYTITPAGKAEITGTYNVDLSKSPAAIDMKPASGGFKDKTLQGIVKVDGDTMTIAFAAPGKDRPTTFESKADSGVTLAVHKKAK